MRPECQLNDLWPTAQNRLGEDPFTANNVSKEKTIPPELLGRLQS